MRRVLMISYLWPPMEGVGLLRALKFARYLPEYGWQPIVLTIKPPVDGSINSQEAKVFRTGYVDIIEKIKGLSRRDNGEGDISKAKVERARDLKGRRGGSFLRELVSVPDGEIGWYSFAIEDGKRILREEKVDLIFSTSTPETAHLIARKLKKHFHLPWIADLRDLWADDHFRARPLFKKMILRLMEKRVLKDAEAVVTVSEPWARCLRSSLRDVNDKLRVIENGFDDEDFKHIPFGKNGKFTITYTGKLHNRYQKIDIFLKALKGLISEGRIDRAKIDIKFHTFGYDSPDINRQAQSYGLGDVVKECGRVGYGRSLEIQRSSDVLLFVQWQGEGRDGWYSAKLYDYIGARRPILAMAEKGGIVEELIRKTSSGAVAYGEDSLKSALSKLYEEYIKYGEPIYEGKDGEISKMTRRIRTGELARLFDSFI